VSLVYCTPLAAWPSTRTHRLDHLDVATEDEWEEGEDAEEDGNEEDGGNSRRRSDPFYESTDDDEGT
jgi:hypothetical protein